MKVASVFHRLRSSICADIVAPLCYHQLRTFAENFQWDDAVRQSHDELRQHERSLDGKSVAVAFCLGIIYNRAKSRRLSMAKIARELGVSRNEVQRKLKIFDLLTQFPRLRYCTVPVTFLLDNATLIMNEWRYQPEAAD